MNVYFKNGSSFVSIYDLVYPVGAYYISETEKNCGADFGGQWAQIDNRMLIGGNSVSDGGTSWDVTLSVENLPSHSHSCGWAGNHSHTVGINRFNDGWNGLTGATFARNSILTSSPDSVIGLTYWTNESGGHSHDIGATGNGWGFNIAGRWHYCYMYHRTS